jgi:ABC-type phosphate/phosphonate transport system substrate-binding protein
MTARLASLPMYLANRSAVADLWELLRHSLADAGLQRLPLDLSWPPDLHAHWLEPDLLLSQTCGYPFTDDLAGKVQLLGAFAYDAPQCSGIECRSVLVARAEHGHFGLAGFRGLRAAFNAPNSQSGYNAFRAMVAPLATQGRFFASALETGTHVASVAAVREGRADLAAIDCVTYAALARYTPQATEGLCIIATTEAYPGLPLITAKGTSAAELALLQSALQALLASAEAAPTLQALNIVGFEVPEPGIYQRCVHMRESAQALGYPLLA